MGLAQPAPATAPPASNEPVATEIKVTGKREPTVGSRIREPLRDIPATVHVLTHRDLEERGAANVVGALSWVAGLQPQLEYGGFTTMTIRGFKEFVSLVDGVRDARFQVIGSAPTGNLAGIDRIEVLKGPASALYGYGGVGGVVNFVHKQPSRRFGYDGSLAVGGPTLMRRATAGVTGPLGEHLAFRADAGIVDDDDFRRARSSSANFAGALQWSPFARHRFVLRARHQKLHFSTDTGLPTERGSVPAEIPLDRRFNTPWDYLDGSFYDAVLEYSHNPTDRIKWTTSVAISHNPYEYKSAEALSIGPNQTVRRNWVALGHEWNQLSARVEGQWRGDLVVPHRALVGYEFSYLFSHHPRFINNSADIELAPYLDELAPVPYRDGLDPQGDYATEKIGRRTQHQVTHGVFVHDTMQLVDGVKLSASGRLDRWGYDTETVTFSAGARPASETSAHRSALAATFRAGVVLQPKDWLTFYGVAGTSFSPVRVVSADGRALDPERGRQYELGARADAFGRRLHVDVAAYNLRKTDVVVTRRQGLYEQAGSQTSRGFEVSATWDPVDRCSLRLGYAYTLARYDSYASSEGNYAGKNPPNVPDHSLTAWGSYRFPWGLGAGAGVRIVGSQWANVENTVPMPAYALASAAGYYTFGQVELALHLDNVFNARQYFVSSIYGTQLTPGVPRTVLVSLRFKS
ncbi:TonB-dependent receptor [Pendulispora albinea]|uniref:TonB-dependent receptor n=1 Tax=Pendulispora albinea TaxID=2741071 RepID=A0ABZ2M7E9_9BACT